MKALVIQPNLSFKIQEKEIPIPKEGEALIKISAASLNRRDQWIREGKYPNIIPGVTIGSDGVGEVVQIGGDASSPWLGKKVIINPNNNWGDDEETQQDDYHVLGLPKNGALAEYIVVNIDRLVEKPMHLSDIEAGALPLSGLTAFRACFSRGGIKKNSKVLISGFGGGVGQLATLFSIAIGAETYITSGTNENIIFAKKKGVIDGFNYKEQEWHKNARKKYGGFDVIIDSAGGDQFGSLIKLLNPKGRLVFYGATNGLPKSIDLYAMFWRQLSIIGTTMGSDNEFEQMAEFVKLNLITPIIGSIRPFDEVIEALDDMKKGGIMGKIVLTF